MKISKIIIICFVKKSNSPKIVKNNPKIKRDKIFANIIVRNKKTILKIILFICFSYFVEKK